MLLLSLFNFILLSVFLLFGRSKGASVSSLSFIPSDQSDYDFGLSIPFQLGFTQEDSDDDEQGLNRRQVIPIVELTPVQKQITQTMASGKSTAFNDTDLPKGAEKEAKLQAEKESNSTASSTTTPTNMTKPTSQCDSLSTRRPWSKASKEDRQTYLQAATCVGNLPGKWNQMGFNSTSIRDDFVLYHAIMTNLLHFNAHLFPCHRLLVNTWFTLLQTKCDYQGDLLYMDFWTYADQGILWKTDEIWSSDYYGGNYEFVKDGNEKDVHVHFINVKPFGVDIRKVDRPIRRFLTEKDDKTGNILQDYMTSAYLNVLLQAKTYDQLRRRSESSFHAYLHKGVGGDMIKTHSVVDDFFWAVHTGMDAFWAYYQDQNNGTNRFAFGGPRVLGHPEQATLHDTCTMLGVWSQDYNVLDLMDIRTKPNCYEYQYISDFSDDSNSDGNDDTRR